MGTKITQLPQVATPTGSDELPISQDTGSGRTTYKTTLDQVKNYVKNTGGGTGTVTSVGVNSNDGSIGVIGSPVVGAGTISLSISSVGLNKLDDGGATGGQVLTYNGSTSTWVASSLSANGFQASLSENGYQKLPSGLIIQWGRVLDDGLTKQFPIPFTVACFSLVGSMDSDSFDGGVAINSYVVSLSEFRLRNGASATANYNYYTAIGY